MKKTSIKILLIGFILCTSISVIGCESSDFEEPVEDNTTNEEVIEKEKVEKQELKKQKTESKKDLVKERQQSLISWILTNVNSKAVVKITNDYPHPDCSGDVYLDDVYMGTVFYSSKNDIYEFEEPYDKYGDDSYVPDSPSYGDDISDEYKYSEHCENCGKAFVGSQSGYCTDCCREILGDSPDFLE